MELTMHEKRKIEILQLVMSRQTTLEKAALALCCTERTVWRMLHRLREKGLEGIAHGNKRRPNARRIPEPVKTAVLDAVRGKYHDINDSHLTELLAKHEGIRLGRETLRSILRKASIEPKCRRRRPKYRSRRPRKEAFGMMLQVDASIHDWLEGRGPYMTLVGAIDDATGYAWARFCKSESTWGYLELMEEVCLSHGVPLSLYSDRHTIFHSPREQTVLEQLKDIRPLTQLGRAVDDLGVEIIKAWSPQAKGRIERLWRTFQDRLIVELRLGAISTMQEANAFLGGFLHEHNLRYCIAAESRTSVFRPSPPREKLQRTLCLKDRRTVNNDHTISFQGLTLQIPHSKHFYSLAKRKVDVLQLKDGSIEICSQKRVVAHFSPPSVTRLAHTALPSKTELKLMEVF